MEGTARYTLAYPSPWPDSCRSLPTPHAYREMPGTPISTELHQNASNGLVGDSNASYLVIRKLRMDLEARTLGLQSRAQQLCRIPDVCSASGRARRSHSQPSCRHPMCALDVKTPPSVVMNLMGGPCHADAGAFPSNGSHGAGASIIRGSSAWGGGVLAHPPQCTGRQCAPGTGHISQGWFLLSLNQPSFRLESYRTGVCERCCRQRQQAATPDLCIALAWP